MDGAHRTLGRIKKLEKHTYFTEDGTGTINPDTVTSGRYFLTAIAEDAGDLPVDLPVWLDVSLVLSEDGTHARVRQTIQSDGDPTKIFVRTAPLGSEGTSSPEWGDGDSWTESDSSSTSITLSDAVDSDSSGTAASSRAVKIAYEKALSVQKFLEQAVDMGEIAGDAVLDGTRGRVFSATPTAATTFSASGVEPGACLLLELHNAGAQVVTWAMQPRWAGGVAPLLAAEGRDLVALTHGIDGWYGVHVAADAR